MTITASMLHALRELVDRAIRERWSVRELMRTIEGLPAEQRSAARIVLGHMLVDTVDGARRKTGKPL